MSTIFIGLDDTDIRNSPGTGHLARYIASVLATKWSILGVTRHQLLFDPQVPMTAKNSANVIHLQVNSPSDLHTLADEVAGLMHVRFLPGSDPGLCVVIDPPPAVSKFGRKAQTSLVTAVEAHTLAKTHNLILRPLGGDGGGIIGALAAVGLASTGNDGRFNWIGQIRDLVGVQSVETIKVAGVSRVITIEGKIVHQGQVDTGDKLRPSLINGQAVLLVEPAGDVWRTLRRD